MGQEKKEKNEKKKEKMRENRAEHPRTVGQYEKI